MNVYCVCAVCLQRSEEDVKSSETGVKGWLIATVWVLRTELIASAEQLLTAEPSLQLQNLTWMSFLLHFS